MCMCQGGQLGLGPAQSPLCPHRRVTLSLSVVGHRRPCVIHLPPRAPVSDLLIRLSLQEELALGTTCIWLCEEARAFVEGGAGGGGQAEVAMRGWPWLMPQGGCHPLGHSVQVSVLFSSVAAAPPWATGEACFDAEGAGSAGGKGRRACRFWSGLGNSLALQFGSIPVPFSL